MTLEPQDWYLITAGASVVGALTVALVGAYLFRHYKRARVVSGIQAEINGLSPDRDYGRVRARNNTIRLSTLPELKDLEMRDVVRAEADRRAQRRMKLVIGGSSRRA